MTVKKDQCFENTSPRKNIIKKKKREIIFKESREENRESVGKCI